LPALIKASLRNQIGLFLLQLWSGRSFAENAQDFGRRLPVAKERLPDAF